MSFYVLKDDVTRGLMHGANDHVDNVPVSLECDVGKALIIGAGCFDSFD